MTIFQSKGLLGEGFIVSITPVQYTYRYYRVLYIIPHHRITLAIWK
jgi:hypothetical protein